MILDVSCRTPGHQNIVHEMGRCETFESNPFKTTHCKHCQLAEGVHPKPPSPHADRALPPSPCPERALPIPPSPSASPPTTGQQMSPNNAGRKALPETPGKKPGRYTQASPGTNPAPANHPRSTSIFPHMSPTLSPSHSHDLPRNKSTSTLPPKPPQPKPPPPRAMTTTALLPNPHSPPQPPLKPRNEKNDMTEEKPTMATRAPHIRHSLADPGSADGAPELLLLPTTPESCPTCKSPLPTPANVCGQCGVAINQSRKTCVVTPTVVPVTLTPVMLVTTSSRPMTSSMLQVMPVVIFERPPVGSSSSSSSSSSSYSSSSLGSRHTNLLLLQGGLCLRLKM